MFQIPIGRSNKDLVDRLKKNKRITSDKVYNAMLNIDRALFCKTQYDAYHDTPQSIGYNATISAPHMHAFALEDLIDNIHPGSRILDVGSGSGYLSACFAAILDDLEKDTDILWENRGSVVGLEIVPELVEISKQNVKKLPQGEDWLKFKRLQFVRGNGWEDLKDLGPFDVIHVGAAAEEVPHKLMEALNPGGRCVIPLGEKHGTQYYNVIDKDNKGDIHAKSKMEVCFVPLVRESH